MRSVMRSVMLLGIAFLMAGALGCTSSPEQRMADAEARRAEAKASIAEEQLGLMQDYRQCLQKAESDQAAADCERFNQQGRGSGVMTKGASK